jgi:hypothetical protein
MTVTGAEGFSECEASFSPRWPRFARRQAVQEAYRGSRSPASSQCGPLISEVALSAPTLLCICRCVGEPELGARLLRPGVSPVREMIIFSVVPLILAFSLPTASMANSVKRRLNLAEDLVARRACQSKGRASRAAAFVCWMPARRRTPDAGACARSRRGLRRSCRADIQACPCRRIPRRSRPAP